MASGLLPVNLWSGISSLLSPVLLVYSFSGKETLPSTTLPLIGSWFYGHRKTVQELCAGGKSRCWLSRPLLCTAKLQGLFL